MAQGCLLVAIQPESQKERFSYHAFSEFVLAILVVGGVEGLLEIYERYCGRLFVLILSIILG